MRLSELFCSGRLRLCVLTIFLCILQCENIAAQVPEIQFINLTTKDGLSHNNVICFCQDRQGFIWIGTLEGLNRFDGNNFIVYQNIPGDSTSISDNSIHSIFEDENGFIWVGTEKGGLNKFNPKTGIFSHFMHDPKNNKSLSNNNINNICYDKNNNLWICTYNGLNLITCAEKNSNSPNFRHFLHDSKDPNSLTNNAVYSVLFDKKGDFWVNYYNGYGIDIFNFNENNFTLTKKNHFEKNISNNKGLSGSWILYTFEDSKGRFWISSWADGLTLFEPSKNKFTYFKKELRGSFNIAANEIENVIEDKRGNIWVPTYSGGLCKFIEPSNGHEGHFINYSFNYNNLFSLADDKILRLFEDRSGLIWIGTEGHGLCKFDPQTQFRNIRLIDKSGLIKFSPSAIVKTSDGSLWIGTKEGILFRFKNIDSKPDKFDLIKGLKVRSGVYFITSFCEDENGTLWITTDGRGIFYILKEELLSAKPLIKNVTKVVTTPVMKFPSVFGIVRENYKKDLVFCSILRENTWILSREDKLKKVFHFDYHDYKHYIWSYENDGTSAWFGSFANGVAKTDFITSKRTMQFDQNMDNEYDKKSIPTGNVYCILKSKNNDVWFGTLKSLSRLLPKCDTLIHYTYKNGISNESVYGILEDAYSNIWASTYNGLSKFNPKTNIFTNYYREDGIQGNEFNQYSYYKDGNGLLYFGGTYGVTIINPRIDSAGIKNTEVKITSFYLSNLLQDDKSMFKKGFIRKSFPYTDEIILPYNENEFSIGFSALEFSAPQKIKYRYKMEGYDNDWIDAVQFSRIANYMNLPPNSYTFKVCATNKEGTWSSIITELKIKINPPFWKTFWFRIIAVLALTGIIVGVYEWKVRNHRKRQALLWNLVEEKTVQLRESNAALESFSYSVSHDLRSPLRTINSFANIIKEDFGHLFPDEANKYFERIGNASSRMGELIEGILKLARLSSMDIRKTEVNISQLAETSIKNLSLSVVDKQIIPQIEPGIIVKGDPVLLATVMDNLISNAIKFSSKNDIIRVDVGKTRNFDKSKANAEEVIFVRDYGAGFDMSYSEKLFQVFQRMHSADEFEGSGIGLANVRKIINRHDGVIWAESEIDNGATFYFFIP